MADILRVALLQVAAHGCDQEKNMVKGLEQCRRARGMGADIALFPELWNIGYTPPDAVVLRRDFDPTDPAQREVIERFNSRAISIDSEFVRSFQRAAGELEMAIVLTYLERWPGAPRNSASLFDRRGALVLTYAKVHSCDFTFEILCTPGDAFPVTELDTAAGPVKVGIMICYDREFPESARILMLNGAELILTPNACDLERHRLAQFQVRAYENMVGVAMANYPGSEYLGCSVAHSPIAFDRKWAPLDTTLVQAGAEEGIYMAEFDLTAIREYRARQIWGNAFRKPRAYDQLRRTEVQAPFVRSRARR